MGRKVIFFVILLVFISSISAYCDDGQIDINSASESELDEIMWVGPATAEKIIEERPFDEIDDLVEVHGIAETKLEDINEEDLACVDDSEEDEKNSEEEEDLEDSEKVKKRDEDNNSTDKINFVRKENNSEKKVERETIHLNPKTIKTEIDNEESDKINYPLIGLVFFGLFIGLLFVFREKSRRKKNEFR